MFKPTPNPPHPPSHLFQVAPDATTETLFGLRLRIPRLGQRHGQ